MAPAMIKPVEAVSALYQQAGCPQSDSDWGVAESFRSLLSSASVLALVPYVTADNVDLLPHNSLVRFRGMVQDMPNPEYYMGALQHPDGTWSTSKFQDLTGPAVETCVDSRIWERRPLMCVPVPGESAWASAERRQAGPASGPAPAATSAHDAGLRAPKRGRGDDEEARDDAMGIDGAEAGEPAARDAGGPEPSTTGAGAAEGAKASRVGEPGTDAAAAQAGTSTEASPPPQGSCVVFLYDQSGEGCVLHDVVDVVGVLSKCPQMAGFRGEDDDDDGMAQDLPLPTSQVLRLHAVLIQRGAAATSPAATAAAAASSPLPSPERVRELRSAALDVLSHPLGGDRLAAEYVLLQLVARVVSRSTDADGGPVGMAPLSLTGCPVPPAPPAAAAAPVAATAVAAALPLAAGTCQDGEKDAMAVDAAVASLAATAVPLAAGSSSSSSFGQAVAAAAAALVPAVLCLPLSLAALNSGGALAPRRDHEGSGRIVPSQLQLAAGTLLVLDETVMCDGRLLPQGVANLQDVLSVVKDQVLLYDFGFYKQPVPVNLPVVVLSGPRSVLKDALPLQLPLQPVAAWGATAEDGSAGGVSGSVQQVLGEVRAYLGAAASLPYALDDSMSAALQADFVCKRKTDPQYGPDQFSAALTLARLAALSFGEPRLTEQTWRHVQAMEATREARLRIV